MASCRCKPKVWGKVGDILEITVYWHVELLQCQQRVHQGIRESNTYNSTRIREELFCFAPVRMICILLFQGRRSDHVVALDWLRLNLEADLRLAFKNTLLIVLIRHCDVYWRFPSLFLPSAHIQYLQLAKISASSVWINFESRG